MSKDRSTTDEESTQPIEIDGLRQALIQRARITEPIPTRRSDAPLPEGAFPTSEQVGVTSEAAPTAPRDDSPHEEEMPSSVTRIDFALPDLSRIESIDEPEDEVEIDDADVLEDADVLDDGDLIDDDDVVEDRPWAASISPFEEGTPLAGDTQLGAEYDEIPVTPFFDAASGFDDEAQPTLMGRLSAPEVKAVFAAAEQLETTTIYEGPLPSMARQPAPEPPTTPEPEPEELPRFALDDELEDPPPADTDDIPSVAIESTVTEGVVTEPAPTEAEPLPIQPGDFELVQDIETSVSPVRSSVPRNDAALAPPETAATPKKLPPYAIDPCPEEQHLIDQRRFSDLVTRLRLELADAQSSGEKAHLLHKIASVHEIAEGEHQRAFDVIAEAFELRPNDEEIVAAVDRIGHAVGRIGELADRLRKKVHTFEPDTKVLVLGNLVYWYERVLGRGGEAKALYAEIERLDKSHPLTLRRAAQIAAMNADVKSQRELLQRALEGTTRGAEKVAIHLALASAHAGTPEAERHYEAALAVDPTSIVALQGLERIARDQERFPQVAWTLERQSEVAETSAERVDALLKLADLHETRFLKRESAAAILERVVAIEPSHPQALRGLERCWHALREWSKLARVLAALAENTYDKKHKVELLERASEVHESKLGDPAGAVEIYRNLLVVDPNHRRALGDLARLYEKLDDWPNVATYKARLAELAPSKRLASQELVKLGDFLSAPDRDPMAARLQYERAVAVDATNALAWEALQRVATASGDARRVLECLEQRVRYTDAPRQRAAVLVELAAAHGAAGDHRERLKALEGAVRADPSNEIAAAAMLDVFTQDERWAEAAPICELLVNAAIRDRDSEALFTRLRLATRIAAALGEADRAMTSALAALDARPNDAGAQADLVAVCSQCRDAPATVARAKAHLVRIVESEGELPADVLVKLAELQRDDGELAAAAQTLERARGASHVAIEADKALADIYLAQGDFPRACKLKIDLARNALTADARFDLLVEAGEIWSRRAAELEKAAEVYEEARAIKPLDHWLLHTLMWVYGELGDWHRLSGVLEEIAKIQESPDRRVKSLLAMAEVVRHKVVDIARAAELYEQVLDLDRKRLDVFEELVRLHTEAKEWEALERAYRKMLGRIKDDDEKELKFALAHQLGLIYRDRLGDEARAYEALDAASRLRPEDPEIRKIVTELLVVSDNLDSAVERLREQIDREPHDPDLYAELYELFLRQHYFDKAWCTVNVLVQLREPSAEQRRFLDDYAPITLADVPGQIVEQAWASHVFHPELDRTLTRIFSLMTPAVARMRHAQLRPELAVGRPFTPAHSRLHDAIRRTFANGAEILSMTPPELLLGDPKATVPFAPALAPLGAIHVTVPIVEARAESLVYVVGKRLAEQRAELAARAFFPSVSDLTALLAAAVRVCRQENAVDSAGAALDASLSSIIQPEERDGIRAIVTQVSMEGGLVDVRRWSRAADLSSMRAGLLLTGDVGPAKRAILAEPQSPSDLTPREKIAELYRFATSDLYSDLRGAIGVAVQA